MGNGDETIMASLVPFMTFVTGAGVPKVAPD